MDPLPITEIHKKKNMKQKKQIDKVGLSEEKQSGENTNLEARVSQSSHINSYHIPVPNKISTDQLR